MAVENVVERRLGLNVKEGTGREKLLKEKFTVCVCVCVVCVCVCVWCVCVCDVWCMCVCVFCVCVCVFDGVGKEEILTKNGFSAK